MNRITHLGRPLDPRLASNRVALTISMAVGVLAYAIGPEDPQQRVVAALVGAVAAFLTWALGRELDPDRPQTANIACLVGGSISVFLGGVSIGALYLLMITARILAGTTGRAPTTFDLAFNLVIAAVVARSPAGWVAGMALAVAMARDVTLPDPAPRRQLLWGAGVATSVTVVVALFGTLGAWTAPTPLQWALVAAGLAGAVLLAPAERPTTAVADITAAPLDAQRLLWARMVVVSALAVTTVVAGGFGVTSVAAAWITLAVGGAVRLVSNRLG